MYAKVEMITPERAMALRANKHKNRPLSGWIVAQFAADMTAGRWGLNGQPIILSEDGELLDGQHRLEAIIQSGVTVEMLVVYDCDEALMSTMDTGKGRTLGDILAMNGVLNARAVAAIARTAYAFLSGMSLTFTASKPALLAFANAHPHIETVASYTQPVRIVSPVSSFGAVLFLATESHRLDGEAHDFAEMMRSGLGLQRTDPAYALRQWLEVRTRNRLHHVTPEAMFAATARAWNAFALGDPLQNIRSLAPVYRESYRIVGLDFELFRDVPRLMHRRSGVDEAPRVKRRSKADEVAGRVFELVDQGASVREIANAVQLGHSTVSRLVAEHRAAKAAAEQPELMTAH